MNRSEWEKQQAAASKIIALKKTGVVDDYITITELADKLNVNAPDTLEALELAKLYWQLNKRVEEHIAELKNEKQKGM